MKVDIKGVGELPLYQNLLKSSHLHLLEVLPELEAEHLHFIHPKYIAVRVEVHEVCYVALVTCLSDTQWEHYTYTSYVWNTRSRIAALLSSLHSGFTYFGSYTLTLKNFDRLS